MQCLFQALDLVEVSQDTLDDVWKQTEHDPPYPQSRMKHLMDVIGTLYHQNKMFYKLLFFHELKVLHSKNIALYFMALRYFSFMRETFASSSSV